MDFFLDTNVPIGYTVIHDRWHVQSKKFINDKKYKSLFWSNLVKKEYDETLEDILDESEQFLTSINRILEKNQKDFFTLVEFERYLLKRTNFCKLDSYKKQKILEEFWNNNRSTFAISSNLKSNFLKYSGDFEELYFQRDSKLKEIMRLHNCGLHNYRQYCEYVSRLNKAGVHSPDCKIIVDAHDCGLTHNNLIFVSNDLKLLEVVLKHDTSHLKIIDFRSCNN